MSDLNRQLQPVTQLYVSVDAATRDGLKAIDRPLFKDFWQRFLDCLTELRDKRQRTVYRRTPVPTPKSFKDCLFLGIYQCFLPCSWCHWGTVLLMLMHTCQLGMRRGSVAQQNSFRDSSVYVFRQDSTVSAHLGACTDLL